jgi:hypothetical protein
VQIVAIIFTEYIYQNQFLKNDINKNKIVMKKYILSIIVIVIMIGFYSCKKEKASQTFTQEDEMMVRSKKIISLINQFDEKMNNNLKSGELIGLDSAVWNMEALQNYNYAYPDSAAKDFNVTKSNYTIDVDANGTVLIADVQLVYNEMEANLVDDLNEIPSDIKHMRFADVALDSIDNGIGYLSVTLGFGSNILIGTYYGFDEDDDWYWGTLGQAYGVPPVGKCDGTMVGVSDGSDELVWRLNNPVVAIGPSHIFTDVDTFWASGFDFLNSNDEYRLYVGWDYPEHNCLTNDILTYYLLESHDIIHTYDYEGGLKPPGLDFSNVEIIDDLWMDGSNSKHYHLYLVSYGILTIIPPHD